jgi:hypothetical protein
VVVDLVIVLLLGLDLVDLVPDMEINMLVVMGMIKLKIAQGM